MTARRYRIVSAAIVALGLCNFVIARAQPAPSQAMAEARQTLETARKEIEAYKTSGCAPGAADRDGHIFARLGSARHCGLRPRAAGRRPGMTPLDLHTIRDPRRRLESDGAQTETH